MPRYEALKDKIFIVGCAIIGAAAWFAAKQLVAYLFYLLFLTTAGG